VLTINHGAFAWGPSAHLYVATKVAGPDWPQAYYGAMAPDMFSLGEIPAAKWPVQHLTHAEFYRLSPSVFALGFATHNGTWGADFYAHCYYDPLVPDTYLTARMKQLAAEFGFSVNAGEDIVEGVVDYLIRKDFGPDWGTLMAATADSVGPAETRQIVDAFAQPLADQIGVSRAAAEADLRLMVQRHVFMTRMYGEQLYLRDPATIRALLVSGFAMYFGVTDATANQYVTRAEELLWDYQEELDAIAQRMADYVDASPYQMPLSWPTLAIAAVLIAGLSILRVRRDLA
jgi:hypothetical protein